MDTAELERILSDTLPTPDLPKVECEPPSRTVEDNREALIRLAEDGELDKSVAYIRKASKKVIEKLYEEYERKRLRKANEFITDSLISKFADTLGGLNAIESPEELIQDLGKDELLRRDVYRLVETLSPYIPCIGFLSGGITTAKHVYNHKNTPCSPNPEGESDN